MPKRSLRIAFWLSGAAASAICTATPAATVTYVAGYAEYAMEARARLLPNGADDIAATSSTNFVDVNNEPGASQVPDNSLVQLTHPSSSWSPAIPSGVSLSSTGQLDFQAVGANASAVTGFTIDYSGSMSASHDTGSTAFLLAEQSAGVGAGILNPEFLHTDLRFDVPVGGVSYTFGGDFTTTSLAGVVNTSVELLDENFFPIAARSPVTGSDLRPDVTGTLAEGTYYLFFASTMTVDSRNAGVPSSNAVSLDFSLSFSAVPEPSIVASALLIGAVSLKRRRVMA